MNAKEAGQKFLDELLAHVPADKQATVREALTATDAGIEALGAATLRQSDYSRQMDQIRAQKADNDAYHQTLQQWWDANSGAVTEYERLRAQLGSQPTPAAPTPATQPAIQSPTAPAQGDYLRKEDFQREMALREQAVVQALVDTPTLIARHMHTFNEVLDARALMADPEIGKLGLQGVYDKVYGPKLAEKAKVAEDARIQQLVDARLSEERKRSPHPYPVNGRETSLLDSLRPAAAAPNGTTPVGGTPTPVMDVVDDAVAAYHELQAQRGGAPA